MSKPAAKLPDWHEAWLNSRDDPWLFATGVMGLLPASAANPDNKSQLTREQDEFLRNFFVGPDGQPTDSPRHSIRSGHGTGKGATLAILALWFVSTHYDAKAVVTANSQDQLRDNNWPEIRKWHRQLPEELRDQIQIDEERLYIKGAPEMVFAVRRTASKSNPEALQGVHAQFVLYLIDEASGIIDIVFEVAQGSLSTHGAMAVLFSNPTKTSGYFYDTHHKLRHRWKCWRWNSEDVPRARGHIEDVIASWGKNSNKYRVRVLGEFPTQDDETVIPLDKVLAAKGRDVRMSDVWPVWGVDVGRFGDDPSTLVARQGNTLLTNYLREWLGLDGAQVAGRVIALYKEAPNHEKPKEIVVDVIGIGASVYDILRLDGSPVRTIVRGCNVAETTAVSEEDYRLRDELWFRGRAWFAALDCVIPIDPTPAQNALVEKMISELTGPTYDYMGNGKRKVESKADLKKRGVPSPNLADAFLNTMAAGIYPRANPHRARSEETQGSWMSA